MILAEGAGALLLGREGPIALDCVVTGTNFRKQREAARAVDEVVRQLADGTPDLVAASANGTFVDEAERTAFERHCGNAPVHAVKSALGESVGASSLWQAISAAQALATQRVPGIAARPKPIHAVLVSTCGLNQQVAGLRVTLQN
jgi:3-oxoacyl-(acyl-carrier-protein) synthase